MFTKVVKVIFLIIILPVLVQYSIYIITKNNDNLYRYSLYALSIYDINDTIINTIIVYSVLASIASIIGIVNDLRKVMLAFPLTFLLLAFTSVLFIIYGNLFLAAFFFAELFWWSLFYGVSLIPSLIITVRAYRRDTAAKKRPTDRGNSKEI